MTEERYNKLKERLKSKMRRLDSKKRKSDIYKDKSLTKKQKDNKWWCWLKWDEFCTEGREGILACKNKGIFKVFDSWEETYSSLGDEMFSKDFVFFGENCVMMGSINSREWLQALIEKEKR